MNLFKYLKGFINKKTNFDSKKHINCCQCKEKTKPLLTISQAAKKNGVTRQAIFFAIKMKRLTATKENETWMITDSDLKEYLENRYSRSKSRKEGELIFDKSKGFYSISEAAKILNKNTNHIYYLIRMGRLKTHRQGATIVIEDLELYKYSEFFGKKSMKNLNTG